MPNLLLTNRCVRSCPYCFARRELEPTDRDLTSFEDLIHVVDLLEPEDERRLALLGGEPTLHPEFVDFVLYLRQRQFDVTVFTSGVMSEARLQELVTFLTPIPPGQLGFVCNLNDPEQTPAPAGEQERVHRFLAELGPWVTPGFNIYRTDFRLDFLFRLVGQYGLQRHLRLGLTLPVPGSTGSYIRPEQVRDVADRLYEHRPLFDRLRVKPGFDCGFPACQFTDEQLGWLHRLMGEPVRFYCSSALDIAPDMSVYSCFPLSRFHRRSLYDFNSLPELHEFYRQLYDGISAELPGIYPACDGCVQRDEGTCNGGGICHLLARMVHEAPVRLPEIEDGLTGLRLPR